MEFTPVLANGNTKLLDEIFKLRVEAWNKSKYNYFINKHLHPDGYSDELDSTATHWCIVDQDKVIGCVRSNEIERLSGFKEEKAFKDFSLPSGKFIFYSKIAVHPDYQHKNLAHLLAETVVKGFEERDANFGLTLVTCKSLAENVGFKYLGKGEMVNAGQTLLFNAYILEK